MKNLRNYLLPKFAIAAICGTMAWGLGASVSSEEATAKPNQPLANIQPK